MLCMNPKQRKLVWLISGLVGLTIIFAIGNLLFNRSSLGPTLNRLRASQDEVLRVNDLASKLSPNLALSQFQANVAALTSTDIALVEPERARASGNGKLPKSYTEEATKADAEAIMKSGAQRNNLTASYVEIMKAELGRQHALVQSALAQTKRPETKVVLELVEKHLESLIEQINKL